MDEIMDDNGSDQPKSLPAFLNVLTILTFVGAGLGILGGIYNISTIEKQKADLVLTEEVLRDAPGPFADLGAYARKSIDHAVELNMTVFATCILCVFGAIMMRKMRKMGFFVYLVGQIAAIAVPLVIVGSPGALFMIMYIFPVAFIIMYGVNLKHLN